MDAAQRAELMRFVVNGCRLKPHEFTNADVEQLVWLLDSVFLGGALKAMAPSNVQISASNRLGVTLYSLEHDYAQHATLKVSRKLVKKCAAVRCASVFGMHVQDARTTLAYVVAGAVTLCASEAAGMRGENCQQQLIARRKFGIDVSVYPTLLSSIRQTAENRGIIKGSIVVNISCADPMVASVCVIHKNVTLRVPDMCKDETSEPKRIQPCTFAAHFYPTIKLSISRIRLANEEEKALFKRMYLPSQATATL